MCHMLECGYKEVLLLLVNSLDIEEEKKPENWSASVPLSDWNHVYIDQRNVSYHVILYGVLSGLIRSNYLIFDQVPFQSSLEGRELHWI